ncbi:MAG: hypothetical protein ACI8RD_009626, partial [Bacillariaceae sp.]
INYCIKLRIDPLTNMHIPKLLVSRRGPNQQQQCG